VLILLSDVPIRVKRSTFSQPQGTNVECAKCKARIWEAGSSLNSECTGLISCDSSKSFLRKCICFEMVGLFIMLFKI
jgi:hypothetical protein